LYILTTGFPCAPAFCAPNQKTSPEAGFGGLAQDVVVNVIKGVVGGFEVKSQFIPLAPLRT
jgi:hypothetical protein